MWGFNAIVTSGIGAGSGGLDRSPLRQWKLVATLLVALTLPFLAGCDAIKGIVGGIEENPALKSAVEEGVSTLADDNPEYTDTIVDVLDRVRSFYSANPSANAQELTGVARDYIEDNAGDLTENERIAVDATLQISERIIEKRIREGDLKEDAQASVGQYFTWIETIAKDAQQRRDGPS